MCRWQGGWQATCASEWCQAIGFPHRRQARHLLLYVLAWALVTGCGLTGGEPRVSDLHGSAVIPVDLHRSQAPVEIVLRPVAHQMLFDRAEFAVETGRPVRLTFSNADVMPHNLLISVPGSLQKVGRAADDMAARDSLGAETAGYAPAIPEVLYATPMLVPGASAVLEFDGPKEPGLYPFSCTFPGHWIVMNGVMHVVARLESEHLEMNAASPRASVEAAERPFVHDWIWTDLEDLVDNLDQGDSPDATSWVRGRVLYREVGCLSCHQRYVGDDGGRLGPAFDDLWRRHSVAEALKHILEPSDFVPDGYRTTLIETLDGRFHSGVLVDESEDLVRLRANPLDPEEILEILRADIEILEPTPLSPMPSGLLSTLAEDEILDLMGYLMFDQ